MNRETKAFLADALEDDYFLTVAGHAHMDVAIGNIARLEAERKNFEYLARLASADPIAALEELEGHLTHNEDGTWSCHLTAADRVGQPAGSGDTAAKAISEAARNLSGITPDPWIQR